MGIGNKARNLLKLKTSGYNVPQFITLDTKESEDELYQKLKIWNKNTLFAVRSSCIAEDSKNKSFAGYFHSEIGVKYSEIYGAYKKVCESFKNHKGSVIIQEFIPSEKSGVLFTNDGNNNLIINSNYGVCKSVVEGWACDEILASQNGIIIKKHHEKNKTSLVWIKDQFENKKYSKFTLEAEEIKLLIKTGKKIESFFNSPQDIEWCFYQNNLYILQSRPITAKISDKKDVIYYDSANVAESYSGIISPLTISFAKRIYKEVYKNLIYRSGVSIKKLENYNTVFNNMVDSFYGRLYYNMNNWYTMMSFIPGYKRNKENLEEMITSNVKEDVERDVKPNLWLKIKYPLIVIWKLICFKHNARKFNNDVVNYIENTRKINYNKLSIQDCVNKYHEIEELLLKKWYFPVENDFLVMTYFGLLKKKHVEEELNKIICFESKTTNQINALINLSKNIKQDGILYDAIKNNYSKKIIESLNQNTKIQNDIDEYFSIYGGRFANELKLESPDIEEDMVSFFKLLQHYEKLKINTVKPKNKQSYILKQFKKYAAQREEFRLLRSNAFSVVRKIFNRIGIILSKKEEIENPSDIYFLSVEEVINKQKNKKEIIAKRKIEYEKYKTLEPPTFFGVYEGELPLETSKSLTNELIGRGCTKGITKGKVKVFKEYYMPEKIDFEIAVAKNTDPGWTPLLGFCKGLIIENGGILSHAAIVSRELGIPTVIGVKDATKKIKDGQIFEIDGSNGTLKIINN